MNQPKIRYGTDALAALFLLLTLGSGIELHLIGHGFHAESRIWPGLHIASALLGTICIGLHIRHHRAWYRALFRTPFSGRKGMVILLSLCCLLATVTGLLLLPGAGTPLDRLALGHYLFGLAFGVLAMLHLLRRSRQLARGLASLRRTGRA